MLRYMIAQHKALVKKAASKKLQTWLTSLLLGVYQETKDATAIWTNERAGRSERCNSGSL